MIVPLASFGLLEGSVIFGAIGAIVTAYVGLRKLRPERDALLISTSQGATTILNDLVKTLNVEVDRCREKVAAIEAENAALRKELAGLQARLGERKEDKEGTSREEEAP